MASFQLEWRKSTKKDIHKILHKDITRIIEAAEALAEDPFPIGHVKLSGSEHAFRIRVGRFRIIYEVFADILYIEIVRVGDRKEVYRGKG